MAWKDVVAADVVRAFQNEEEMGVSVTYTTVSGTATTIIVFIEDLAGVDFVREVNADYKEDRQAFFISLADIASPSKGDTITFNSNIYKLDVSVENDEEGETWECVYRPVTKRHGSL